MTSTTLPVPYPENSAAGLTGDDGQKQVSSRPHTIHCEGCDGGGRIRDLHFWWETHKCPLCNGTGREPIPDDKTAQQIIEGRRSEDE